MDLLAKERELSKRGYKIIACVDEVGRGCLFGPVVAGAVVFTSEVFIEGVNDSKKLSEKKRNHYDKIIKEKAWAYGIGRVESEEIDKINIRNATHKAMVKAVENLKDPHGNPLVPDFILVDGESIPSTIPLEGVLQGDQKVHGIACASIIAKVYRDKEVVEMAETYPVYGLEKHKGYGTKIHREALMEYGPTPQHRRSFLTRIKMPKENKKTEEGSRKVESTIRKNHLQLGRKGEALVREDLLNRGIEIIENNYRKKFGEIDIIAKRGKCLVFIEVKARSNNSYGEPIEAITSSKVKKIKRIAEHYYTTHQQLYKGWEMTFDVAEVICDKEKCEIRYHQDAF